MWAVACDSLVCLYLHDPSTFIHSLDLLWFPLHPHFLSEMVRTAHLKFWGKFAAEVAT